MSTPPDPTPPASGAPPFGPANILVVDDVPQNIEVLSGILRSRYRVRAATSGARALSIVRSDAPPDLILLDIMMPELDGLTVCRRLKSDYRTRHIPVVFVTAMTEVDDEAQGFEAGCVDYITKPVSPPLVLARVATHLALADQQRELERLVQQRTAELQRTRLAVVRCLGKAAEFKDDDTGLHVVRMSHYSRLLGLASGMRQTDADLLLHAAPMHDVGKIGVPDHILKKPGRLTPEEWELMKQHVEFGGQILGVQDSELLQMARTIALSHHEKWDGSGYPLGLSGEQIPLVGRIAALADVFDALTSVRPYKRAWSVDEALEHTRRDSGRHFDPGLVARLEQVMPEIERVRQQYADAALG